MSTVVQTVAAASSYNGTAGRGLVLFEDVASGDGAYRARILSVSFATAVALAGADPVATLRFAGPNFPGTATEVQIVREWLAADAVEDFYLPCVAVAPKGWRLEFVTNVLGGNSTLVVDWVADAAGLRTGQ